MKKIVYIAFLAIIISSCSEYQKAIKSDDVGVKYPVATKLYEAGKYSKAIKLFEQIQVNNYRWKLIIEFGFDQREIAEKVIQKYSSKYQFFPDYSGMERFLELSL